MSKRILVTGGAGYIGAVLVDALVKLGISVTVFDKFYFGKDVLAHEAQKVRLVTGDIRKFPEVLFKDVQTIIHLAALSNDPLADFNPQANWEINTHATIALAVKAKRHGIQQFIFASSCSIYDRGLGNPLRVSSESAEVAPTAAYSQSKLAAEKGILPLGDKNFCVTVLRKGTVYGFSPRMRYDLVVNTMVKTALSEGKIYVFCGGEQWRPLIAVEDVAVAYLLLLQIPKKKINGQIFNIAHQNYLIKDVAVNLRNTLSQLLGRDIKLVLVTSKQQDRTYQVSLKKSKQILKFIPKKTLTLVVTELVSKIEKLQLTDFVNPRYYNIKWMRRFL